MEFINTRMDALVKGNRILIADGDLESVTIATVVSVGRSSEWLGGKDGGTAVELFTTDRSKGEIHHWSSASMIEVLVLHGQSVANIGDVYSL